MTLKFYTDEHITLAVAQAAARFGLDVTCCRNEGMLGRSDEAQLAFASAEGRCIITNDEVDFLALAMRWWEIGRPHYGILIIPYRVTVDMSGAVARALLRVAERYPEGLPNGAVIYLSRPEDA